jgi:predicted metal-dependent hydrolase
MEYSLSLITINNIEVTLLRKRIKNINLRINAEGVVSISAPLRCPMPSIQRFLQEKQEWITKHLNRKRAMPLSKDSFLMTTGERHQYLGQTYSLMVHEVISPQKIVLQDNHLCFYVQTGATASSKQILLKQWQCAQMKALLPSLISKWEPIIGVQVNQWGVRAMKTRWGSCNPVKKSISLNLHLIQKPLICLEYVLVHELVHLLEASHNQRFYTLMSQFMPDWKEYRALLKEESV